MKSHFPDKYQCQICMISLTRSDNLKRHIKLKHGIREGSILNIAVHASRAQALPSEIGTGLSHLGSRVHSAERRLAIRRGRIADVGSSGNVAYDWSHVSSGPAIGQISSASVSDR